VDDFEATLRKLTVRDDSFVEGVLGNESENVAASELDPKIHALVRIAALIAMDAAPQSYAACVHSAQAAGASSEEIVGTLVAVIPVVGVPRVVSAAPKLGLALGYDLDAELEAYL
jgi:alkylhydroperoxidase/carboxymuconolactone decarboxylase family protein YurZ